MRLQTEALCARALARRDITAWVGANDLIASFAQDYLKEKKRKASRKIAIAGFDDNITAMQNRLTSYNLNLLAVTHSLVSNLLYPGTQEQPDEGFVVERESSALKRLA